MQNAEGRVAPRGPARRGDRVRKVGADSAKKRVNTARRPTRSAVRNTNRNGTGPTVESPAWAASPRAAGDVPPAGQRHRRGPMRPVLISADRERGLRVTQSTLVIYSYESVYESFTKLSRTGLV